MSRNLILIGLAASVAACSTATPAGQLARGVGSVNVPVVTRADYAFDIAAPDGSLPSSEAGRLDAWFRSMDLGYGDSIYIDGPSAAAARNDVARVAGNYGLMVSAGAPVTAGMVAPGTVRVVVSRTRASVPNCPNWSRPGAPSTANEMMSNFGCGVNSNLAAMIANPEDLVHGREGSGVGDNRAAVKALQYYRNSQPTGTNGLKDISTKKGSQ